MVKLLREEKRRKESVAGQQTGLYTRIPPRITKLEIYIMNQKSRQTTTCSNMIGKDCDVARQTARQTRKADSLYLARQTALSRDLNQGAGVV